jgi:chromosome segregation ATPase
MRKLLNLVSTLFFLLLLGVLAYVFSRMLKKKKATIDKLGKENLNLLQQLADNKKEADRIVEKLKGELIRKEKHSNAEISELLQKLECGENSMEELKQKLSEKEINRQEMESLIQQLENDSRMNATALDGLRAEMEKLQEQNRMMMSQKVELLKSVLEQVAAVVYLHETKCFKEETKEKRIREGINSLKKDYFAGENQYRKVEALVNLYLDNAMWHFRKEISLPNEADYRRVCYMFAGVSGQVIGQIMGESKDAVYQRRSRLLKKIASLSCVHKEMFVLLLSK